MSLIKRIFGDELETAVPIKCELRTNPVYAVVQNHKSGKTEVLCPNRQDGRSCSDAYCDGLRNCPYVTIKG